MKSIFSKKEALRVRFVFCLMLMACFFLSGVLWKRQVAHGDHYQKNLEKQSIRRVRLSGIRGKIVDRNGFLLADNRPSYCIAIYLEELRQPNRVIVSDRIVQRMRTALAEALNVSRHDIPYSAALIVAKVQRLLNELSARLGLPPEITGEQIYAHVQRRRPLPLLAWKDIDEGMLARWAEQAATIPGIDIYTRPIRIYPAGDATGHVVGYVGARTQIEKESDLENEERPNYYLPEMRGRFGLEKQYNDLLKGEAGGRLVRIDVSGYRYEDLGLERLTRAPKAGLDIALTIDLRIQRLAEKALGARAGAVVVLDPRNGDILALVSSPRFDPNWFIPGISEQRWNHVLNDAATPLFDRAVSGGYAPGSTFKPVVALAGVMNDKIRPDARFECPGYVEVGDMRFHCAHGIRHGMIDLQTALACSCNVYFYKLGLKIGHEYIFHMAHALNFGAKTGTGLEHEGAGLLPGDAWLRKHYGHGWRVGDTVNLSVGQGFLTVTPLQMALMTTVIANGGHLYQPRLVRGMRKPGEMAFSAFPPRKVKEMNWPDDKLDTIRKGMRDVFHADYGTAHMARVPGITMAGKTGTAEYGPKGGKKHRGWIIAYAPYEAPQYAVAMVVDEAVSGGQTVGPLIKELIVGLFSRPETSRG